MLKRNVPLHHLNTFGLPASASWFTTISTPTELAALIDTAEWHYLERFILGGGSNLIFTGDFAGLVLHVKIHGMELVREDSDAWIVRAGAGERWHSFVYWTLAHGWLGLENLAFIPGTVGGAPVQNIGAYGIEISERVQCLETVDLKTGKTVIFDRSACQFSYRDSVFKGDAAGRYLINAVVFRLPKLWEPLINHIDVIKELEAMKICNPTARNIADAIVAIRTRKLPDPERFGNAGSFFKNPVVDSATFACLASQYPEMPYYIQPDGMIKLAGGWLIERCGWKGRKFGPVGVYEKQALVLVNCGGASGRDVLALAFAIQKSVQAVFGVKLVHEPVLL